MKNWMNTANAPTIGNSIGAANWLSTQPQIKVTKTTNGDKAYTSTGTALLDFFTTIGAHRDAKRHVSAFENAYRENGLYALRAIFYARDVRGGQGERELFRACFRSLPNDVKFKYAHLIAEYGRWDDLFDVFNDYNSISPLIQCQIHNDWVAMKEGKSVSLLAKWMPSENASSKRTREKARKVATALGLTARNYRVMLSALRSHIDLVETKLSAKDYEDINIQMLPSRALKKYKTALKKYVPDQFASVMKAVTEQATRGIQTEVKINTKALYPYEVLLESDRALRDAQWVQMVKDKVYPTEDTLVVCDVSGSMGYLQVNQLQPIHFAISLAMYFAETNSEGWKDQFITFSNRPTIQRLVGNTLTEKATNLSKAHWEMNTDLDKVFQILFDKAVQKHLQAPKNIVVISDMQFDSCMQSGSKSTFEKWKAKFAQAGLVLPNVVFWNVGNGSESSKPVTAHQSGAILVSGKSPAASAAFKNSVRGVTPYVAMMELLDGARYAVIV